jgi:nucleoid DNA-binding protein
MRRSYQGCFGAFDLITSERFQATHIMPTLPPDRIENVLVEIVRESLIDRAPIHVDGLGTFEVEHRSSAAVRSESGELRMVPPRDEIVFHPSRPEQ